MSHRWLFRVNVANERETDETKKARGLGHAMKCVSVAKTAQEEGHRTHFSIEGADDVGTFFESHGVTYDTTSDHRATIERFDPDVIVTDINYLDTNTISEYREAGTVVNLAPRGDCKYYADLSFNSARIEDVPKPSEAPLQQWFTGPEYAILNPDFVSLRNEMNGSEEYSKNRDVIIQMGGVDQANMTRRVIEALHFDRFANRQFTVVAGPFNPHVESLRQECRMYDNVSFAHDPPNFAETVANHRLGILASGISTYEAMAVGVPSINLGLTQFHDSRGEYLDTEGLIQYLGQPDELDPSSLNKVLDSLFNDEDELKKLRRRGLNTVDGKACNRIVQKVSQLFSNLNPNGNNQL